MPNASQTTSNFKGDNLSVNMFGAVGDGIIGFGSIAAGSNLFTTTEGTLYEVNVGNTISIASAGLGGVPLTSTIIGFLSSSQVLIADTASVTVTGVHSIWGTDNTQTFQNAMNAVPQMSSPVIRIPPSAGVYIIRTVYVNSGLTICGGGWIDILDDGTTTGRSLFLDSTYDVTIRDITISSTNAGARTGVYGNIRLLNTTHTQIKNCTIIGSSSVGIHAINAEDLLIEGNTVFFTLADGIHVSRGSSRVRIVHNCIHDTGDDGIGLIGYISLDGVTSYPPMQEIVVADNNIYNINVASAGRGIALYGVIGGVVVNNTINGTISAGILVGAVLGSDPTNATHMCYQIVIADNITLNNSLAGIYVSYARAVKVVHNYVDQQINDGISVASVAKDVSVRDNIVGTTGGRGIIATQQNSTDSRLILELFTNVGDLGWADVGVSFVDISENTVRVTINESITCQGEIGFFSTDMSVTDNRLEKPVTRGIFLEYCSNSIVSGNDVEAPTEEGILLSSTTQCLVLGNMVLGGGYIGISFVTATYCEASGNMVMNNAGGGIYVGPTSGTCYITGNVTVGNTTFQVQLDLTIDTSIKFNNFGDDWTGLYFNWPRVGPGPSSTPLFGFQINGLLFVSSVGSPEGSVTAPVGSYYLRADASALQSMYIKQSGSGSTGWIQIGTVPSGGTGLSTLTTHGVLIGEGSANVNVTGAGTTGQFLGANTGADPTWQTLTVPALPISVPNGGTGDTSLTAHGVLLGEATSPVVATAAGNVGQPFLSGGVSADGAYGSLEHLEGDASGGLTCTTSFADIPGATITLDKTGVYIIVGEFDMFTDLVANVVQGRLNVAGAAYGQLASLTISSSASTLTIESVQSKIWVYPNTGSNVAKLQAQKLGSSGTGQINQANTSIKAVFLG